ncbi:phage neck terminator protein [Chitiniphilus shinanonensis]|uniref:phage neck terminator protein n=1 Tax=Chitiniphilus shinanonensis TaxID=553088 RepID=UPI00302B5B90
MGNTSATGGYLTPEAAPLPPQGDALDAILQKAVVGMTGLPGAMVRPRWQPGNPKQPDATADWCAIGIGMIQPDDNSAMVHVGIEDGHDIYLRHEEIQLQCSFYGPNSMRNAALLRDGIYIPQNSEPLLPESMAFVRSTELRAAPDLINNQWIKRYDLDIWLRRQIRRRYPILNILSAPLNIQPD